MASLPGGGRRRAEREESSWYDVLQNARTFCKNTHIALVMFPIVGGHRTFFARVEASLEPQEPAGVDSGRD